MIYLTKIIDSKRINTMDIITIFEDNLKTVTVVHVDKELFFKLFIFSWSIIN